MQIVGKIRMAQTPHVNHWWHVTLYVSPRGLTTTEIPALPRAFEIEFDIIDHWLVIRCNDGNTRRMQLRPRSVADFYRELRGHLRDLAIDAPIYPRPNEVADAIPFDRDEQPRLVRPGIRHAILADSGRARTACSGSSGRRSSASAVPSTCSGARRISP